MSADEKRDGQIRLTRWAAGLVVFALLLTATAWGAESAATPWRSAAFLTTPGTFACGGAKALRHGAWGLYLREVPLNEALGLKVEELLAQYFLLIIPWDAGDPKLNAFIPTLQAYVEGGGCVYAAGPIAEGAAADFFGVTAGASYADSFSDPTDFLLWLTPEAGAYPVVVQPRFGNAGFYKEKLFSYSRAWVVGEREELKTGFTAQLNCRTWRAWSARPPAKALGRIWADTGLDGKFDRDTALGDDRILNPRGRGATLFRPLPVFDAWGRILAFDCASPQAPLKCYCLQGDLDQTDLGLAALLWGAGEAGLPWRSPYPRGIRWAAFARHDIESGDFSRNLLVAKIDREAGLACIFAERQGRGDLRPGSPWWDDAFDPFDAAQWRQLNELGVIHEFHYNPQGLGLDAVRIAANLRAQEHQSGQVIRSYCAHGQDGGGFWGRPMQEAFLQAVRAVHPDVKPINFDSFGRISSVYPLPYLTTPEQESGLELVMKHTTFDQYVVKEPQRLAGYIESYARGGVPLAYLLHPHQVREMPAMADNYRWIVGQIKAQPEFSPLDFYEFCDYNRAASAQLSAEVRRREDGRLEVRCRNVGPALPGLTLQAPATSGGLLENIVVSLPGGEPGGEPAVIYAGR